MVYSSVQVSCSTPLFPLIIDHHRYTGIQNMELELLMKFRSAPEVSSRLEQIVEAVTQGKKPYARAMLHAFLERLTREGV